MTHDHQQGDPTMPDLNISTARMAGTGSRRTAESWPKHRSKARARRRAARRTTN